MKLMYYFQHQNFTFSLLNVKNLNNREIQALVYFGIGISNGVLRFKSGFCGLRNNSLLQLPIFTFMLSTRGSCHCQWSHVSLLCLCRHAYKYI